MFSISKVLLFIYSFQNPGESTRGAVILHKYSGLLLSEILLIIFASNISDKLLSLQVLL